jgi:hypothetical protein
MRALTHLDLSLCDEVTDVGVRAVSTMPLLASLNLRGCDKITDEAVQAVSSMSALTSLDLGRFHGLSLSQFTDAGVLALSRLPALTHLDVTNCYQVTAAGVEALRSTTTAPSLRILPYDQ